MTTAVEQMPSRCPCETDTQMAHALREVMQEIALARLNRGGFFENAALYGGTCLRIFYCLPRFSEDLDFFLLSIPSPAGGLGVPKETSGLSQSDGRICSKK